MFVKMSILFFYLRTFTESRLFRHIVLTILFVLVASHIAFLIALIFVSSPPSCEWKQFQTDQEYLASCSETYPVGIFFKLLIWITVLTVVLDLIILILPCRAVLRLHLPRSQKLVILITLTAGIM